MCETYVMWLITPYLKRWLSLHVLTITSSGPCITKSIATINCSLNPSTSQEQFWDIVCLSRMDTHENLIIKKVVNQEDYSTFFWSGAICKKTQNICRDGVFKHENSICFQTYESSNKWGLSFAQKCKILVLEDLTHLPLVSHVCISVSGQHGFR